MEIPCSYYSAQLTAMTTHIRRKHLQICIMCRLCRKWAYSTTNISLHLKAVHHDVQNEWFEPMPPLEGDKVEVTDAILAANLQEIEDVQATPDDLNQDE